MQAYNLHIIKKKLANNNHSRWFMVDFKLLKSIYPVLNKNNKKSTR